MSRLSLWGSDFCCLSYKWNTFFFLIPGPSCAFVCFLHLCSQTTTRTSGMHVGRWSCTLWPELTLQTAAPPTDLPWLLCCKTWLFFVSCAKEFTTRKYFEFHDIKKNDRTNRTAEKITCLQKVCLYYYFNNFLQLWRSRWLDRKHRGPGEVAYFSKQGRIVG